MRRPARDHRGPRQRRRHAQLNVFEPTARAPGLAGPPRRRARLRLGHVQPERGRGGPRTATASRRSSAPPTRTTSPPSTATATSSPANPIYTGRARSGARWACTWTTPWTCAATPTAACEHRPELRRTARPAIADVNGDGVARDRRVGQRLQLRRQPVPRPLPHAVHPQARPHALERQRLRLDGDPAARARAARPLAEDYNVIESACPTPVVADLDGDGRKEILYPSYDGKLHAYWLDKTEHGSWPYDVPRRRASASPASRWWPTSTATAARR